LKEQVDVASTNLGADIPRMVKVGPLSERTGIGSDFIYRLAKSGEVESRKCGKAVLIVESSFLDWLDRQRQSA
jgi:excisionase family DNA binding protein